MRVLISLIAVLLLWDSSEAKCKLSSTGPFAPFELITFGSKHFIQNVTLPTFREQNDSVKFYCANGFLLDTYYKHGIVVHDSLISLKCLDEDYFFQDEPERRAYVTSISCTDFKTSEMYESHKKLANCEKATTYVVGQHFNELGSVKSLAICYDVVKFHLKYIAYTAQSENGKIIKKTQMGEINELGLDIKVAYTEKLFNMVGNTIIADFNDKNKELFGGISYEYASLVQGEILEYKLTGYEDMVSTIWFSNLRTGNWHNWLNALHQATVNGYTFDVRVGVSDVLKLPTFSSQCLNRTLSFKINDNIEMAVPKLIWAHVSELLPSNSTGNDIVIVAHNTPFITNDELNHFCIDICDTVSWLKDTMFDHLKQYATHGVVQCCDVKDVANKLDNFPIINLASNAIDNSAEVEN